MSFLILSPDFYVPKNLLRRSGSTASHRIALCVVCVCVGCAWIIGSHLGLARRRVASTCCRGSLLWFRDQVPDPEPRLADLGPRTCTDLVDSPRPSPALGLLFYSWPTQGEKLLDKYIKKFNRK